MPAFFDSLLKVLDPIIPDALLNKNKAKSSQKVSCLLDRVDGVVTPFGIGRITDLACAERQLVHVSLEWGAVATVPLSQLVQLQLVRAPQPIGYALRHAQSGLFEKLMPWGEALVDPRAKCVESLFVFEGRNIRVRIGGSVSASGSGGATQLGRGILKGFTRKDGIVCVELEWGALAYVKLNNLTFLDDEDVKPACQQQQQQQSACGQTKCDDVVSEEETCASTAQSSDSTNQNKKNKHKGKK